MAANELGVVNRLHCSTAQALDVYADLCAAWAGVNVFGGDTAEVYAYKLWPYCPMGWQKMVEAETPAIRQAAHEMERHGRDDLAAICLHAAKNLPGVSSVTIDGMPIALWRDVEVFHHRARVRIVRES